MTPAVPSPSALNGTSPTSEPTSAAAGATAPSLGSASLQIRLVLVAVGLVCLALSRAVIWLRPEQAELSALWAMLGLALAALPVFYDSLTSLKSEGFEATKYYMDQFVALAILACFATGKYTTGSIVAAILIIGQILEERSTLGVEEAVQSLLRLSRVKARRALADGEELVDANALITGDRVRVLPGDTLPADGEILHGYTTLDHALITGESLPIEALPGTKVYAGTTNLTGRIEIIVGATHQNTVLGRVTRIVEEAKSSRAPVMRLIDRYTQYYMPLVLTLAGFVLFFTRDIDRAIAVIIVAMPCAFVLASPSAMIAALAVASRLGVLVKSSRFFELARHIDTVVFDKTGTLTTGRLQVVSLHPEPGIDAETLLEAAATLEVHSTHPIARAIIAEAERRAIPIDRTLTVTETPGRGLRGGNLAAGRKAWLEQLGASFRPASERSTAGSTLFVARGRVGLGFIVLADTVRPESSRALDALRREHIQDFVMLTGDNAVTAAHIAAQVGIDHYIANCLPIEKLAEVERLQATGRHVLVVGDGINDAPALAAGSIGVAMGALGSDVAIQTADVALMGSNLQNLAHFLQLSDHTLRIINQNLLWGLGFILLFVALSASGFISPIAAAVLHEVSAFFVIFNSARILRFDDLAPS